MSSFLGKVPSKDRVRLSSVEKQQAVKNVTEKKVEFDNDKLLQLLRNAKSELQGMRLIHLHLSLLRERDSNNQMLVRTVVSELSYKAAYLQVFAISNGDVIVMYRGLKLASITEVCQKLEQLFLARTVLTGLNPYRENSLYSIMELSLNFINVTRFVEELERGTGVAIAEVTKPPITLEEMAKLERAMAMFDLSPFLLNQPIINIADQTVTDPEYYELYISIRLLQERLCPDYDIAANKWLFQYFTANLDQSVLRALGHGLSFMRGRRIGLNINLSSVMSTGFVKFDERLPLDFRGNIVLEISKSDLIENLTLFDEVCEFAKDRKYSISIDALNPFWVTNFDLEYLDVQYAKIFWSPYMLEMDPNLKKYFLERISEQEGCRFVLARCDTVASLIFAREVGIKYVQGRAVDNIMRKGVSVRQAIQAADGMMMG